MEIKRLHDITVNAVMPPAVLCLGNFDGVHRGHAALLKKALEIKNSLSAKHGSVISGVLTFAVPPYEVLQDNPPPRITSFEEKMSLFSQAGIDRVYVADFPDVRYMMPGSFTDDILIKKCNCVHAVCGFNFRYGTGGAGNAKTLIKELSGQVSVVGQITYNDLGVSSTAIRRAVAAGDMETAAGMLGRPFSLTAPVSHGHAVGSKLGFATANQEFQKGFLIPAGGVYISSCRVDGKDLPAVSDVGKRPTFGDGDTVRCETHIINFSGDLYGQTVRTSFHKYLRPDIKFPSVNELIAAVRADTEAAAEYARNNKSDYFSF